MVERVLEHPAKAHNPVEEEGRLARLSHKEWRVAPRIPQETSNRLAPFSPLAAQLLHNRGITELSQAEAFLSRDESRLEDPLLLPDMERAIARIHRALLEHEAIGIFGDFDTDGITGTALLAEGLTTLGARVIPYIPHRVEEGHGLNSRAISALHQQGITLLITVDCGVTSKAEVEEASSLGMDTIITDHHVPPAQPPRAWAIVNPSLASSSYPFPHLAGVGLAFKLVQGLCHHMGLPWDRRLLQMAALGTVTDMAPLVGENRYIVAAGLRSLSIEPRPGLKELLRLGGMEGDGVDTESISFILGPRLNAPGRLEHAMTSYNLLRAPSLEEAQPLAQELERMNRERQELTQRALEKARQQLGPGGPSDPLILLCSEEFTPGIVGLVASRLVEEHYRPAVVVALDGHQGRGSARSIPEFNLASALTECQDLFVRFGGHPRAAGFIIPKQRLPALRERLLDIARRELSHLPLEPTIRVDAHVRLASLPGANLQFLHDLAPYGEENPTPVFLTRGVEVIDTRRLGAQGQHLRLKLKHGGAVWDAMAFGQGEAWQEKARLLDVVYSVGVDRWSGAESFRLVIEDFRPVEGPG
ncbi:MAG: single-stranded-DNA-specific exonuclease RecJ [Chloroflexi bacterium]|nr:single-stranded-DNA-specific exonuclease RecJ [Chloroflexota bacterium]